MEASREEVTANRRPEGARTHAFMLVAASVLPAICAASHAVNVADAAHDEGVVRAVGLGWTGAWRSLDAVASAIVMAVPIGTRSMRAAIACAMVLGLLGGILYSVARRLLAACAAAPRFGAAVAAVASITATVGAPMQLEAGSPGGSVVGAVLALAPLAVLVGASKEESFALRVERLPTVAMLIGIAIAYEPGVGAVALVSCAAFAVAGWPRGVSARAIWPAVAFAAVGLVPFALAIVRARGTHAIATEARAFSSTVGEAGASHAIAPLTFLQDEVGLLVTAFALVGAGLALLVVRARPLAAALLAAALVGIAATAAGVPGGPTRFGAPVLAAVAATLALAAVAMQAVVRLVARARVPFAKASAAMVVVLELTFPVHGADDAMARSFDRARGNAAVWDDVAFGPLGTAAMVFVREPRVMLHVLSSRASGELRGDLAFLPIYDLNGRVARQELAEEPRLATFFRDVSLGASPEELAFSDVSSARPLAVSFDPKWERALARHLVPAGLFMRFETEPRGASDRKKALEAFVAHRDALLKTILTPGDPELVELTVELLRARAVALVASGDRDLLQRGVDDLRMFAPNDEVGVRIGRRVAANTKGVIDVKDVMGEEKAGVRHRGTPH